MVTRLTDPRGTGTRRAGVRVGDQLLAVAGTPVADLPDRAHIARLMRGPRGTLVMMFGTVLAVC